MPFVGILQLILSTALPVFSLGELPAPTDNMRYCFSGISVIIIIIIIVFTIIIIIIIIIITIIYYFFTFLSVGNILNFVYIYIFFFSAFLLWNCRKIVEK